MDERILACCRPTSCSYPTIAPWPWPVGASCWSSTNNCMLGFLFRHILKRVDWKHRHETVDNNNIHIHILIHRHIHIQLPFGPSPPLGLWLANRQPTNQKTSKATNQQPNRPTNQQSNKATNYQHAKQQKPKSMPNQPKNKQEINKNSTKWLQTRPCRLSWVLLGASWGHLGPKNAPRAKKY